MRIAAAALLGLVARAASAQSTGAQAETLFRQGKELLAAGKTAEACAAFEASEKLEPTISTLLNLASCREKNNQLATAWGLFLQAERDTRTATDDAGKQLHQVATDRASKLEPRLSKLTITVGHEQAGLIVERDHDSVAPAAWGTALPIDGGVYRITAHAPGTDVWSTSVRVEPEHDSKTVEIPALPMKKVVAPAEIATPSNRRTYAVVALAGGGVLLATGITFGVLARDKWNDAKALCPDLACDPSQRSAGDQLVAEARLRANVSTGLVIAGVVAAGTGVVLWATSSREAHHIAVRATPSGVTIAGQF